MKKFISFATVAVLGFGLAGCGGSSEQNFIDQADEFDALANRVDSMALSGPRVVDNTGGRASFSGKASIGAGSSRALSEQNWLRRVGHPISFGG